MATTGGTNLRDDIMRLDETGEIQFTQISLFLFLFSSHFLVSRENLPWTSCQFIMGTQFKLESQVHLHCTILMFLLKEEARDCQTCRYGDNMQTAHGHSLVLKPLS